MFFWAPILGLIGIIVGAVLQYFFNRKFAQEQQLTVLKNEAYVDYLLALTKSAYVKSGDFNKCKELAANAKARIAVYGDSNVIKALADFEKLGANLKEDKSVESFLSLVGQMRNTEHKSLKELYTILIGPKI